MARIAAASVGVNASQPISVRSSRSSADKAANASGHVRHVGQSGARRIGVICGLPSDPPLQRATTAKTQLAENLRTPEPCWRSELGWLPAAYTIDGMTTSEVDPVPPTHEVAYPAGAGGQTVAGLLLGSSSSETPDGG
jgi:hypothetical protein